MADIEQIARDVAHTNKEMEHIYSDLYVGDGKANPSITTRLSKLEDAVDSISKNLSKMVWLLVGIFLTIVADLAVHASGAHL